MDLLRKFRKTFGEAGCQKMFDDCLGAFLRCAEDLIGTLDRVNIGGGYVFRLVLIYYYFGWCC